MGFPDARIIEFEVALSGTIIDNGSCDCDPWVNTFRLQHFYGGCDSFEKLCAWRYQLTDNPCSVCDDPVNGMLGAYAQILFFETMTNWFMHLDLQELGGELLGPPTRPCGAYRIEYDTGIPVTEKIDFANFNATGLNSWVNNPSRSAICGFSSVTADVTGIIA